MTSYGSASVGTALPTVAEKSYTSTASAIHHASLVSDYYEHTQAHPTRTTTGMLPDDAGSDSVQPARPASPPPSPRKPKQKTLQPRPLLLRSELGSSSEDENAEDHGSGSMLSVSPTALRLLLHERKPPPPSPSATSIDKTYVDQMTSNYFWMTFSSSSSLPSSSSPLPSPPLNIDSAVHVCCACVHERP